MNSIGNKYTAIIFAIQQLREEMYDLVEIPHLIQSYSRFKGDVKIVAKALAYIVQTQPKTSFSIEAQNRSQLLFQKLICLQEVFLVLEEQYKQDYPNVTRFLSSKEQESIIYDKAILHSYFFFDEEETPSK